MSQPKQITLDLSKHVYYFSIPCYSGQIVTETAVSLIRMTSWMSSAKIPHRVSCISSGALIDAVRNECVHEFLKTDADTWVTIDADIEFDLPAIQRLLVHSHSHPIVLGAYPTRVEPSNFIISPTSGKLNEDGLLPVESCGFGFVAIQRKVFEQLKVPHYVKNGEVWNQYFKTGEIGPTKNYIGEDCWFLQEAIRQGYQPLVDPKIVLNHHGRKKYEGSLMDVLDELLELGKEEELGASKGA